MGMQIETLVDRDGKSYVVDAEKKRFEMQAAGFLAPAQKAALPDPRDWNNRIAPELEQVCQQANKTYELKISTSEPNQVFVELEYIGLSSGARTAASVIDVINSYNATGTIVVSPDT